TSSGRRCASSRAAPFAGGPSSAIASASMPSEPRSPRTRTPHRSRLLSRPDHRPDAARGRASGWLQPGRESVVRERPVHVTVRPAGTTTVVSGTAGTLRVASPSTIIRPSGTRPRLSELWAYRELLYFLVWRDLKVRYKQTVLGIAWAVLQPVATTVVFAIFLG